MRAAEKKSSREFESSDASGAKVNHARFELRKPAKLCPVNLLQNIVLSLLQSPSIWTSHAESSEMEFPALSELTKCMPWKMKLKRSEKTREYLFCVVLSRINSIACHGDSQVTQSCSHYHCCLSNQLPLPEQLLSKKRRQKERGHS